MIEERRRKERGDNLIGLLEPARNTYAYSIQDAYEIVIGGIVDLGAAGGTRPS